MNVDREGSIRKILRMGASRDASSPSQQELPEAMLRSKQEARERLASEALAAFQDATYILRGGQNPMAAQEDGMEATVAMKGGLGARTIKVTSADDLLIFRARTWRKSLKGEKDTSI